MTAARDRVPESRIEVVTSVPSNRQGNLVLYWMTACRRTKYNFALQRALYWSAELGKPLLVLEELRCNQGWDSTRFHRFVLQGMDDNEKRFVKAGVSYYPFVERLSGDVDRLVRTLAKKAAVVVTDYYPLPIFRDRVEALARTVRVRIESVDSNGILPISAAPHAFPTAFSFRRFLQNTLPDHLLDTPLPDPLAGAVVPAYSLPKAVVERWPLIKPREYLEGVTGLAGLPIDHSVPPVRTVGGSVTAEQLLASFVQEKLHVYAEKRNDPDIDATSGLSPYLHFGHISAHQVFEEVSQLEGWSLDRISPDARGGRRGWWGMSENAETFLDQLITWRELGFNTCRNVEGFDQYESLPQWSLTTLDAHARDHRPYLYAPEDIEAASTHDAVWNAAQTQLVQEGRIHNYLRMLWGKKILEWSRSPRDALTTMIHLNNKYALDGRDPNSYSGIFWVLGRYDRPWGPERPVFGKVRYMSSQNTARKVRLETQARLEL